MIHALTLASIALVATVIVGYPAIRLLRRYRLGKEISKWGPDTHQAKAGTPTMGGLFVLLVVGIITLAANFFGRYSIGLPLVVIGSLGVLGFVDDLGSIKGREQWALNKRVKFVAFLGVGVAAAIGLYEFLDLRTINIPYDDRHDLGVVYIPIAIGVIVLTAGGVAVSDGLDGLAAGSLAIAYAAYGFIALFQEQDYIGAVCLTVAGSLLGFLWHNAHPAQVFMGDVGALALGGGLAIVAFMTGQWIVLPLIGVIFLLEGASDAVQVAYFRLTGGKRILRMAPLHHHFEETGWAETQVVQRFWVIGALGAAVGVMLALEV
jgi:phospho-N-acetylmuramoyl-pentapeptide-transferase